MKTVSCPRPRRVPMVFRITALLLLIAACIGIWSQSRPVGGLTRLTITLLGRPCPAVVRSASAATVADGALAGDRVVWAILADRLAPRRISRCTDRRYWVGTVRGN